MNINVHHFPAFLSSMALETSIVERLGFFQSILQDSFGQEMIMQDLQVARLESPKDFSKMMGDKVTNELANSLTS